MRDQLAIGRIEVKADGETGSGFAVSEQHVLTAFHCVRGPSGKPTKGPISFCLNESSPVQATVETFDASADVAVLELRRELPEGWKPVPVATTAAPLRDVPFQIEGFPADRHHPLARVPVHGRIVSTGSVDGRTPSLVLFTEEVAAGIDPHGFSGAPVLVDLQWPGQDGEQGDWAAVAVVRWAPFVPGESRVGYGGSVYAAPLEAIAARSAAVEEVLIGEARPRTGVDRAPMLRDRRIDFSEELRSADDFVGRETLIERIATFADQHDRGYVHLEASAGLGKSALAARFAVMKHAPSFFADASRGTVRADQCLRHLSTELVYVHGLSPDLLNKDVAPSEGLASILSAAVKHAAEPLWLVVDGLDEAEDAPPGANPLLLPRRLPPGVFVLTTSREPASKLDVDPATPLLELHLSADGEDERRDLRRFIENSLRSHPALRESSGTVPTPPQNLAERLADAAEGNFMYVTYVLADLAEGEIDLETAPKRLAGYYERRFWAQMEAIREESTGDWDNLFRPVLSRLAVAAEPVDVEWLAQQVEQPADQIEQLVLRPWRRFLRVSAVDGGEGWRIVHRSFADFLESKLDLTAAHREVARALRADLDGYGERHLTEHLRAGGESGELITLMRDPAWERRQLEADPSGGLFVHDIEQTWLAVEGRGVDGATRQRSLDLEVWCALAVASTRSSMQLVPPTLITALVEEELWTFERARDTVRQTPDGHHRALGLIALARWEPALVEDALAVIDELVSSQEQVEIVIAALDALAGDRHGEVLARFLDGPATRDRYNGPHAAARLVPHLPEELLPRAFEIARSTEHQIERTVLFLALTQRFGRTVTEDPIAIQAFQHEGLPTALNGTLEVEPDSAEAATAATALLDEMAEHDGFSWAGSQRNDAWVLKALAPRLDLPGLRKALDLAEAVGVSSFNAVDALAEAMAHRGDPLAGWNALMKESYPRRSAILAVATRLSSSEAHLALEGARELSDPYIRAETLGALARLLPQTERRPLLVEALPSQVLGDRHALTRALRGVSPYLDSAEAGKAVQALKGARSNYDVAYGLAAAAPALNREQLISALGQAGLVSYKADDIARATILRHLPPEDVLDAAKHAVLDPELGAAAAVSIAVGLDPAGRDALLEWLSRGIGKPSDRPVLGLGPYLSAEQVAQVAPRLDRHQMESLAALRAIFPGRLQGESAAVVAARINGLNLAEELVAHTVALLAEDGRGKDAVDLAGALQNGAVTTRLAELSATLPPEHRPELAELALGIFNWEARLHALARLAANLDRGSLRQVCARLEEMSEFLADQVGESARPLALLQRRASLLPLYARLTADDRQQLIADLRNTMAASDWEDILAVMRVIDPEGEQLPDDVTEALYPGINVVLRQIAFQSREDALIDLGRMMPVIIAIDGPSTAKAVGEALLDAAERWP
jgi:hypothetical protein